MYIDNSSDLTILKPAESIYTDFVYMFSDSISGRGPAPGERGIFRRANRGFLIRNQSIGGMNSVWKNVCLLPNR